MRSLGYLGAIAALAFGATTAEAQFRIGDVLRGRVPSTQIPGGQIPTSEQERTGRTNDKVPPGHLPPKGMCRVWIDGVPPGRQPAPTDCQTAVATKPANARVLWGDQASFPGKGKDKSKAKHDGRDDDDRRPVIFGRDDDRRDVGRATNPGAAKAAAAKSNGKGKGKGGR